MPPDTPNGGIGPSVPTKDEFWKEHTGLGLRMSVLEGGLACLVLGIVTMMMLGALGLPDGLLNIGLGWGICAKRSRACAVAAGLYYAFSQMFARLTMGSLLDAYGFQIFVYVLLGLMMLSIYGTFTFQRKYREYIKESSSDDTPGAV